ncbi:MAG: Holliday junction resolvase RuvX [Lachnospiraceae bacterium]|nr:Holliday junction resolvase RuvX [Lachnospiraceae bacterium]
MKIMGLDYGSRTVGVAVSDALLMTSQPREILRREREHQLRRTLARIAEIVREEDIRLIVLGKPVHMDTSEGVRVGETLRFRDLVTQRTGLPVELSDERLTTVEADEMMDRMGIRRQDRRQYVDMLAASVILQEYMENHRTELQKMLAEEGTP